MDPQFNQSFNNQQESLNKSIDNETNFLKRKIVQMHHKLIKQLELTKQLQQKVNQTNKRNEQLQKQNQILNRKLSQGNFATQKNKQYIQKNTNMDKKITELQNKNQLLRIDLETMRKRILAQMMEKNTLQQNLKDSQEKLRENQQKYNICYADLKKKQLQLSSYESSMNTLKNKLDLNKEANIKLVNQIQEIKKSQNILNLKLMDYQVLLKTEKDKYNNLYQQYKNFEIQLKNTKFKLQKTQKALEDLKNKQYYDQKQKNQSINNTHLQKLTYQMNQMNIKYKEKQRELQKSKSKPSLQQNKRQRDFQDVKTLVQRLQNEQKQKSLIRKNTLDKSPLKNKEIFNIVPEKKDYMSKINEIGILQNTLLQTNIMKNKILNEIDKIDQTKIKTHQLINRRRRLQQQLKKNETIASETKTKLKSLNII